MGKLTIKCKVTILIVVMLVGVAGLCASVVAVKERNLERNLYAKAKVLMQPLIYQANHLDFSELEQYTYTILSLTGEVLYSNDAALSVGEAVELKVLSGMSKGEIAAKDMIYSAPFVREGIQAGTIYVSVPYSKVREEEVAVYVVIVIIVGGIVLCMRGLRKLIVKDILEPIGEIHKVTNSIREGNLEDRVRYDYDGEIGTLCHDFEALRSDLLFSTENERRLKEKEKLLLAYVSHDLRTPIAIISGYVEGIHRGIAVGDRVQEYTAIILRKIGMLNSLIDDILEHSKAQLHEFEIKKVERYSKNYFEQIMIDAKQDIEKKGLSFSYSEIPEVILSIDEKRIKQVMQNLLGNSMKFTDQGEVSVTYRLEEKYLMITVKDTGIGIAAADIPMVFTEFFRGEKARTQNVPGSGLGLCIAKYIVEQHGGRIECDSILDHWTVVEFSLPL